jgi:hypothetical protein
MKSMRMWLCVVVLASVATATVGAPLQAAETSTSSTSTTIVVSPSVSSQRFTWSQRTLTVGTTLKASKLVSSKIKGTRTYRATGVCSVRKGVLRFTRTGNCRVSVSVTVKGATKIMRSSKLFTVKAKTSGANWTTSGMPDPIGCTPAAKNPLSGTPYPDSLPGIYDFQTAWTCDYETIDARPLFQYFKSEGWTPTSSTDGVVKAIMKKGSKQMIYLEDPSEMPAGQTLLILMIK